MTTILAAAQSNSIRGNITENVKTHTRLSQAAAQRGASLIIFPELSLTGYEPDIAQSHSLTPTDPRLTPLQTLSDSHNISILAGAPYISQTGLNIAAFLYQPHREPEIYTKHHLHTGEDKHFKSGQQKLLIKIKEETIAPAICADISHPEHPETAAMKGATVYAAGVMITPNGYAADSKLLRTYAKRHSMIVLLSNYAGPTGGYPSSGRTAAWDTEGNLLAEAPDNGEAIVLCIINGNHIHGEVVSPPPHKKTP